MEDKFLTLGEVSKYLKIPKSTLYKLSQKGKIPSCKIGKQLRFRKSSLDKWAAEKELTAQAVESLPGHKQKYLLLIDDDDLVLKTLTKFLKMHGFKVEPVQTGEEALEKAKKLDFDLVITDMRMPGIDGLETIKRLREFRGSHHRRAVPEIIISAYMDTDVERQAQRLGVADYIYKPFAISEFIEKVKSKIEVAAELN